MSVYYFYGDTPRRALYVDSADSVTYNYSGAWYLYTNTSYHHGDIRAPEQFTLSAEHYSNEDGSDLPLSIYQAARFSDSLVTHNLYETSRLTTDISDFGDQHTVYRLTDKELARLPAPFHKKLPENIKNDTVQEADIVIVWSDGNIPGNIPQKADYYIWVVENKFYDSDALKKLTGEHIIVIRGDTLRTQGAKISRSLSWEQTANDAIWQCSQNKELRDHLLFARLLIIPFGFEGAVVLDTYNDKDYSIPWQKTLWFLSGKMEGDIKTEHPGFVPEAFERFIFGIVNMLCKNENDKIGVLKTKMGDLLTDAVDTHVLGYFYTPGHRLQLNSGLKTGAQEQASVEHQNSAEFALTGFNFTAIDIPDRDRDWRIADNWILSPAKSFNDDFLFDIINKGADLSKFECPALQIGDLIAIDRTEIESFSYIRNILRDYLSTENPGKPLCIAVFGQPGSGKSFGVKAIAKSLAADRINFLEYNLSQFGDVQLSSLFDAFHDIQDEVLKGKTPIVFFDEFDTAESGWLKCFLMPMEDGFYSEHGVQHPLGKCVFVFAGGINHTYAEFASKVRKPDVMKVTDFLSRLKGFIDIPNIDMPDEVDYVSRKRIEFRRAIMLPGMLKNTGNKGVVLSQDVMSALLKTDRYKHGARSMQAIIGMSQTSPGNRLEISDLPPDEQWELHADSGNFGHWAQERILLDEATGRIARTILFTRDKLKWESVHSGAQAELYAAARQVMSTVFEVLGLSLGLCGDKGYVPEQFRSRLVLPEATDSELYLKYAKRLFDAGGKFARTKIHNWDALDDEIKQMYFQQLDDILSLFCTNPDNTSLYLFDNETT